MLLLMIDMHPHLHIYIHSDLHTYIFHFQKPVGRTHSGIFWRKKCTLHLIVDIAYFGSEKTSAPEMF